MDDDAAPTTLQRGLVGADQILRLFLEFDVGVADQAEPALPGQAETGEHPVKEQAEQVLQHHEADRLADAPGSRMKRSTWLGSGSKARMP